MNRISSLINSVDDLVEKFVGENMIEIMSDRETIGLDPRCGLIFINQDCVAVPRWNAGSLNYYGGMEYVDSDNRRELGDYVFYFAENSRVKEHIDRYFDNMEDEEAA